MLEKPRSREATTSTPKFVVEVCVLCGKNEENKGQTISKFVFIVLLCIFLPASSNYVACISCLALFVVVFFIFRAKFYYLRYFVIMRVLFLSTVKHTMTVCIGSHRLHVHWLRYFR